MRGVQFDGVWLDDRQRCTWALCDVSFQASPGATVALVAASGEGGPEAVLDLLCGRRVPVRGRVLLDGAALADGACLTAAAEVSAVTGERRVAAAGVTFVARPTQASLSAASRVLVFTAGLAVPEPEGILSRAG